jgi:hypothetical protein
MCGVLSDVETLTALLNSSGLYELAMLRTGVKIDNVRITSK